VFVSSCPSMTSQSTQGKKKSGHAPTSSLCHTCVHSASHLVSQGHSKRRGRSQSLVLNGQNAVVSIISLCTCLLARLVLSPMPLWLCLCMCQLNPPCSWGHVHTSARVPEYARACWCCAEDIFGPPAPAGFTDEPAGFSNAPRLPAPAPPAPFPTPSPGPPQAFVSQSAFPMPGVAPAAFAPGSQSNNNPFADEDDDEPQPPQPQFAGPGFDDNAFGPAASQPALAPHAVPQAAAPPSFGEEPPAFGGQPAAFAPQPPVFAAAPASQPTFGFEDSAAFGAPQLQPPPQQPGFGAEQPFSGFVGDVRDALPQAQEEPEDGGNPFA